MGGTFFCAHLGDELGDVALRGGGLGEGAELRKGCGGGTVEEGEYIGVISVVLVGFWKAHLNAFNPVPAV